jgi:hypothetical protein
MRSPGALRRATRAGASWVLPMTLLVGLSATHATAGTDDLAALFGSRVTANERFKAPFAAGDFDGDGELDALYLVSIRGAAPDSILNSDVTVLGMLFGQEALGDRPEGLALAVRLAGGKGKFLLTGYEGEGVTAYFESPIWSDPEPPLGVAKRGSESFEAFRRQEPRIKFDVIVVGTEAGIDTALYWTGAGFALFQPSEEP